ncbi:cobalamin biosynthesis protein [Epibacterium sp. SM1969]|uniref:Cobalamin biosynthesis protein CobD n=1 Tax=Tritonibacter aquimaris TaxID=2663379 RepID=A0A844AYA5_9RHOB|nr:cobalamin biosynthesis protein [Tritonibacter aquimaris]
MNTALLLIFALLLDALLGEPRWLWSHLPHPAVVMGRLVGALDKTFNAGTAKKAKGVLAVLLLVAAGIALGCLLSLGGPIVIIPVAAILLAQRSLVEHVRAVAEGLEKDLPAGRFAVSMIVSRDTKDMDESQIARSAIESGAENLSDGVIAPAFWFLVAGLPGLIAYKMVNTADSMIGYRTDQYRDFGWAAARLDDVLNLGPARLTALMCALLRWQLPKWRAIVSDARQHRSPNAGWPEAAMSRVLGVSLAGPRSYDGTLQEFPWVNPDGRKTLTSRDIRACCSALWQVWGIFLMVSVALAAIF